MNGYASEYELSPRIKEDILLHLSVLKDIRSAALRIFEFEFVRENIDAGGFNWLHVFNGLGGIETQRSIFFQDLRFILPER